MSDQRSVTPFEQKVFDLISRENPPHPVILSQLISSMELRYITRSRASIDPERLGTLLYAAAEIHSAATDALADSTFKTNEEASDDAASRSSSGNASSVDSAAPTSTTSLGNKIAPQAQLTEAHECHESANAVSFASDPEDEQLFESARLLSQAIPLPRGLKAKAVTVLTANSIGAKDATKKHELGWIDNEVQNPQHAAHSLPRSLKELDAELEKMQSEAGKNTVKSVGHSFFGKRSGRGT